MPRRTVVDPPASPESNDPSPSDSIPGSVTVPPAQRGPIPPKADENPKPASGTDPQAANVARRCAQIAIDACARHGVTVSAAAHQEMVAAFQAFVAKPGNVSR